MAEHKLLFAGPVGAGKTTAIASISDTPPVTTEVRASDETRRRKERTTVAMDYGLLRLPDGGTIHLYGTPGQERFDFMWEIATKGALGLVLLVDNDRDDPLGELEAFVESFRSFIEATAVVVGVTHTDTHPEPSLRDHQRRLTQLGLNPPVFTVDARDARDVSLLIEALLFSLEPDLNAGGEP